MLLIAAVAMAACTPAAPPTEAPEETPHALKGMTAEFELQ